MSATLRGESDPAVSLADMAGWRDLTTAESRLRAFPGGHFYVQSAERAVVALVNAALAV